MIRLIKSLFSRKAQAPAGKIAVNGYYRAKAASTSNKDAVARDIFHMRLADEVGGKFPARLAEQRRRALSGEMK